MAKGIITADRMARGLDALASMKEAIRNYRVEEVHVMATSAMRGAKNGQTLSLKPRSSPGLTSKSSPDSTKRGSFKKALR